MKWAITNRWGGFLLAACLLAATSCMPDPLEEAPKDNLDTPLAGLTASSSFTWSTFRQVEVSVKGLPLPAAVERRMTLSTMDGDVFFAGLQSMSEDFNMQFTLPNHVTGIKMTFGDIEKEGEIQSSKVVFQYFTALDNTDLDE
jgi:hypothetical protein